MMFAVKSLLFCAGGVISDITMTVSAQWDGMRGATAQSKQVKARKKQKESGNAGDCAVSIQKFPKLFCVIIHDTIPVIRYKYTAYTYKLQVNRPLFFTFMTNQSRNGASGKINR